MKRSHLTEAGLTVPEYAAFAEIDFEHESLYLCAHRCGVEIDEPAFFSWLGVTMFLNEDAIDAVPRCVASFPAGSEIVLTLRLRRATLLRHLLCKPPAMASLG